MKRLLLTNYVFFRCCGEAAEKKNGSAHFTLLSLLTILFVCFSAAKFTYIILFTILLCVAAEKKMVPGSVHLHYLLYFCVFLCGEAAEKKMVVFTYNYFAAQPQRKI